MLGLTVPLLCIPGQAAYPCQPDLAANSEQCPFAHKGFWRMFPSRPQQMCGRRHRDNVLGFLTHVFPQGKQRPVRAPQREAPQKRGRTMGCDVFIMVECLPIILLECLPIPLECSPIIPLECSPIIPLECLPLLHKTLVPHSQFSIRWICWHVPVISARRRIRRSRPSSDRLAWAIIGPCPHRHHCTLMSAHTLPF